jgi:hypothetical protein
VKEKQAGRPEKQTVQKGKLTNVRHVKAFAWKTTLRLKPKRKMTAAFVESHPQRNEFRVPDAQCGLKKTVLVTACQ